MATDKAKLVQAGIIFEPILGLSNSRVLVKRVQAGGTDWHRRPAKEEAMEKRNDAPPRLSRKIRAIPRVELSVAIREAMDKVLTSTAAAELVRGGGRLAESVADQEKLSLEEA